MSKSDPQRHEPDQPRRRQRHDRAEDPQGEDRPRALARHSAEALKDRPEALNLVTIYAALTDRTAQSVTRGICRQGLRRVQAGAWPTAGRDAVPDPGAAAGFRGRSGGARRDPGRGLAQGLRPRRADAGRGVSGAGIAALDRCFRHRQPRALKPPFSGTLRNGKPFYIQDKASPIPGPKRCTEKA